MAQDATTVKIKPVARQFNAPDVVQQLKRTPQYRKISVGFGDTTTVNLFELPENTLVREVLVRVTTAFDASGSSAAATATITMPNDTGTETLFDAGNTLLQSTGFKPSTTFAVSPSTGGFVTLNYTPGTTGAGQMEVYIEYVEYDDEL